MRLKRAVQACAPKTPNPGGTTKTEDDCIPHEGKPNKYQSEAIHAMWVERELDIQPWEWIESTCKTDLCLNAWHMVANKPRKLNYPRGICVYCGNHGFTNDHLIPRNWSGEAGRRHVMTVPACGTCNSVISDAPPTSITGRRRYAQRKLRKKYARVLAYMDYSDDELDEFGPALRAAIENGLEQKAHVRDMLSWPTDAAYDARALERSGIPDPYAIGLID